MGLAQHPREEAPTYVVEVLAFPSRHNSWLSGAGKVGSFHTMTPVHSPVCLPLCALQPDAAVHRWTTLGGALDHDQGGASATGCVTGLRRPHYIALRTYSGHVAPMLTGPMTVLLLAVLSLHHTGARIFDQAEYPR